MTERKNTIKQQKPLKGKPPLKEKTYMEIPQWAPFAIIIFTALLYIKALQNNFAGLDDNKYIFDNPLIKDFSLHGIKIIFSSFYAGFYYPLILLTYFCEYALFRFNPMPYHLVNVLLHLLNTFLVFKLAEQLSGKRVTALVVSLLFAVHPMHVESVAWITERKDVLYSLFYLLSLLSYLRYLKSDYHFRHYIIAILFFILSALSKPTAVTLPVLLIVIDLYKGRKINRRSILEKVPLLLLSLFFGVLFFISQKEAGAINDLTLTCSYFNRIFLITYAIAFYFVMTVAPFHLTAMHYYPNISGGILPWNYYASLPFVLLLIWLAIRRNSFRREMLFGILFFLVTISVMVQIIPVGFTITSERYSYLPYIGLFYIAGQWISNTPEIKVRNIGMAIFFIFVILFSCLTWNRIGVWKNDITLFTDVIKKAPDNCNGYLERGNFRSLKGDLQGALLDYNASIQLDSTTALTYNNRGMVLDVLGKYISAIQDYDKAILLDPKMAKAYNNRGIVYQETGDPKRAIDDYTMAIKIQPDFADAYYNRGLLYERQLDILGACADWKKAQELGNNAAAAKIKQYAEFL